ncbi:MAG TPA: glycosyltransferase family 4 protein [Ktedonobacterales bacterium]
MALAPIARPRAVMGLMFYPRGGSAQVARMLARLLPESGWDVTLVSSSLTHPDHLGDARTFFAGLDTRPLDCTAALGAPDPLLADPPLHPSYEDRPGAPDRVFAAVDDATYAHQVAAWARALDAAGAGSADLLHLHHLTPLNAAAALVAPDVPVVGHLHGTELLMLDAIAHGPPVGWTHAAAWAERMRQWAAACRLLLVPSPTMIPSACALLGVPADHFRYLPNGVDTVRFDRRPVDRQALWQRLLVDEPRGWAPGEPPGSVAYTHEALQAFTAAPVLLYVGRFTALKCLDRLIAAYALARPAFAVSTPLVLVGGFPGEWEGEHPLEAIARTGAHGVYLAGWHDHAELPDIFNAADAIVLPSAQEPFGQVLVEGMACGLPAIAVDAGGPSTIVVDGRTGWLVPPDGDVALAAALVEAVNDAVERRQRGEAAYTAMRERYGWPALAASLAAVYESIACTPIAPEPDGTSGQGEELN